MERPISLTETDIKEPALLLRHLRTVTDRMLALGNRLGKIETSIPNVPRPNQIKTAIEATGTDPLNVNNLVGILAQPQYGMVKYYTSTPTGLDLQNLAGGQLVSVTATTTSTSELLYRVQPGNPNTLVRIQ